MDRARRPDRRAIFERVAERPQRRRRDRGRACRSAAPRSRSTSRCSRTRGWCIDRPRGTRRIYQRRSRRRWPRCAPSSTGSGTRRSRPTRRSSSRTPRRTHDHASAADTTVRSVDRRRGADRASVLGLHRGVRPHQAAGAQHARRRDRRDRLRAAGGRAHLRPRRRRQRVPVGARARLRAAGPRRVQLGHQPALADRDRPREGPARSRCGSSPRRRNGRASSSSTATSTATATGWEGARAGVDSRRRLAALPAAVRGSAARLSAAAAGALATWVPPGCQATPEACARCEACAPRSVRTQVRSDALAAAGGRPASAGRMRRRRGRPRRRPRRAEAAPPRTRRVRRRQAPQRIPRADTAARRGGGRHRTDRRRPARRRDSPRSRTTRSTYALDAGRGARPPATIRQRSRRALAVRRGRPMRATPRAQVARDRTVVDQHWPPIPAED